MPKIKSISEYIPTNWVNGTAPAINATNLNHIEQGIKTVTDEAISLDSRLISVETGTAELEPRVAANEVAITTLNTDMDNVETTKVDKAGDTMTGHLILEAPTASLTFKESDGPTGTIFSAVGHEGNWELQRKDANNIFVDSPIKILGDLTKVVPQLNGNDGKWTIGGNEIYHAGNLTIPDPFVAGMIMMWGNVTPPTGWALCDGSNGTPDLRGQFVMGATGNNIGETGGYRNAIVTSHTHVFTGITMPEHSHSYDGLTSGTDIETGQTSGRVSAALSTSSTSAGTPTGTISTVGEDNVDKNLPPFYRLAYIMKL